MKNNSEIKAKCLPDDPPTEALFENVNVSGSRKKLALDLTDELRKRMGPDKN
jgi:hypothetical protein